MERTDIEIMWNVFLEIWEDRPEHVCYESGDWLGNEPSTLYFHHVLPKEKGQYPKYKLCKWNIITLTWDRHASCENSISNCPRVKAYRDFILKALATAKDEGLSTDETNNFMENTCRSYRVRNNLQ